MLLGAASQLVLIEGEGTILLTTNIYNGNMNLLLLRVLGVVMRFNGSIFSTYLLACLDSLLLLEWALFCG